jgi:signal transduction histidine kinase
MFARQLLRAGWTTSCDAWYRLHVTESDDLRASRARLATSAVAERRRVERALHDGVQQDLIAVSVRLQLLRELLGRDVTPALELLDELQRDTRDALDRVRALACDIYPALLDAHGLPDALREAARATGHFARVDAPDLQRRPPEVESAVYFCFRALLERAEPGAELTISLREDDRALRLEIAGLDGVGLSPARDLVEAAGGTVLVEGSPGAGGLVVVTMPV